MLKCLLVICLAVVFSGALLASQQRPASRGGSPINSPEPITMIALAGGAVAAGGLAYRRRKSKGK